MSELIVFEELNVRRELYNVDGYKPITKTIYEFNGCKWHGCLVELLEVRSGTLISFQPVNARSRLKRIVFLGRSLGGIRTISFLILSHESEADC